MKGRSPLKEKSYMFALTTLKEVRKIRGRIKEYDLTRQLLRSGTSIGANIEEAGAAQSKKDFISKMAIASKEAREAHYWLRLLSDAGMMSKQNARRLITDCNELIKMLTATVKTSRKPAPVNSTLNTQN